MEANQNSGATTIDSAVKRISAFLNSEPTPPTEEEAQPEAEVQDSKADTSEDDPKPAEKHKVKYKDEEIELTLDELIKGNMMERDYRHKTSEISDQRRALDGKAAKLDESLADAKLLLDEEMSNLDSPEMKQLEELDPEAYLREVRRVQAKIKRFETRKAERTAQIEAQKGELAMQEREQLLRAIPEWLDPAKMDAEGGQVLKYLADTGFNNREIADMLDHRFMVQARKAMLYDQVKSANPLNKKVVDKPKVSKAGASVDADLRGSESYKQAREKLKVSGNRNDAAALVRQLFKG